jgi:putative ABC transport system substrate-binding protein
MRRREFITLLGSGAAVWPLAAGAQQSAIPVLGYLSHSFSNGSSSAPAATAFRRGLRQAGYVEGENIKIESRWSEGQSERLPALAADLVRRQVAAIVAVGGVAAAMAAKAATSTIPVVFTSGGDPVKLGLVKSLNRPGGNLTGVSFLTAELTDKRLDLLHQIVPLARTFAYLFDPRATPETDILAVARSTGRQVIFVEARGEGEFEAALATLVQCSVDALVVSSNPLFNNFRDKLLALVAHHRIPAIYAYRESAVAGGLISYGANIADAYGLAGTYTGQVLKGVKPADLPVQQPTRFDFVINLKTAKSLGLTIPLMLQVAADEVIE